MKKIIYTAAVLLAVVVLFSACNVEEIFRNNGNNNGGSGDVLYPSDTPVCVTEFVNTHFNNDVVITKIKQEPTDYDYYEVRLSNGFELEFNRNCDWVEIDGNHNVIPQSILNLLPVKILQYVDTKYPTRKIKNISKKHYGYEIELNGDIDIEFDVDGNFLRIDK